MAPCRLAATGRLEGRDALDGPSNLAEQILDQAADAVIFADRSGTMRRWNGAAAVLFGFPAEEALGQSLDLITPEYLRAAHWRGFDAAMKNVALKLRPTLTRGLHKSGRKLYVEMTFAGRRRRGGVGVRRRGARRDGARRARARLGRGRAPPHRVRDDWEGTRPARRFGRRDAAPPRRHGNDVIIGRGARVAIGGSRRSSRARLSVVTRGRFRLDFLRGQPERLCPIQGGTRFASSVRRHLLEPHLVAPQAPDVAHGGFAPGFGEADALAHRVAQDERTVAH